MIIKKNFVFYAGILDSQIKNMLSLYDLKLFSWIEKEIIDNIVSVSNNEFFRENEVIFREWDISNWKWYIIISWEIYVLINNEIIAILKEWDIFWEIALLNEEQRTATIIAKTDLETIVLDQENLFKIIENNHLVNKDIMKRIEENLKNT